ncbi:sulfite exporter TauE/SafE family protein [Puteibacter caeruleilacunae]|nr:sulfite exporter TauE/SafE family protein [Puteibacter caeruleilacunae]
MDYYLYAAIIGVGIVAGFINTLAGGGSLLALPMLMFLGLPANIANGTNRVAIFLQNLVGVSTFTKKKVIDPLKDYRLVIPALFGSILGAYFAVDIDERILEIVIGGILGVMFFMLLFKPEKWVKGQAGMITSKPSVWQYIVFFAIGVYGGFIQAGVGFFLLSGLVLSAGYDLVKANAMKVFIVLCYTACALIVFAMNKQIDWGIGLTLAIGNMIGAYLGATVAVKKGALYVRYFLLLGLMISALKLFGLF